MTLSFFKDLLERAGKTALQAFIAVYAAVPLDIDSLSDLSVLQKAGLAAGMAALSMVTSVLSSLRGDSESASAVK